MLHSMIDIPSKVICGLDLKADNIPFTFGSLLTNNTVGPMNKGAMLL